MFTSTSQPFQGLEKFKFNFQRLAGCLSRLSQPELIWRPGWRRRTSRSGTPERSRSRPCWACGCTRTADAPGPPLAPACWGRRAEPWQALVCSQTARPPPAGRRRLPGGRTKSVSTGSCECLSIYQDRVLYAEVDVKVHLLWCRGTFVLISKTLKNKAWWTYWLSSKSPLSCTMAHHFNCISILFCQLILFVWVKSLDLVSQMNVDASHSEVLQPLNLHCPITTAQTPKDITRARWQRSYPVFWHYFCTVGGSGNFIYVNDTNTHLVCRCHRSSSAASGTSLQASHELFWPERTGQQEESHRWRNLLHIRQKGCDLSRHGFLNVHSVAILFGPPS